MAVNFELPSDLTVLPDRLDDFIEQGVRPIQARDNERFFDHGPVADAARSTDATS